MRHARERQRPAHHRQHGDERHDRPVVVPEPERHRDRARHQRADDVRDHRGPRGGVAVHGGVAHGDPRQARGTGARARRAPSGAAASRTCRRRRRTGSRRRPSRARRAPARRPPARPRTRRGRTPGRADAAAPGSSRSTRATPRPARPRGPRPRARAARRRATAARPSVIATSIIAAPAPTLASRSRYRSFRPYSPVKAPNDAYSARSSRSIARSTTSGTRRPTLARIAASRSSVRVDGGRGAGEDVTRDPISPREGTGRLHGTPAGEIARTRRRAPGLPGARRSNVRGG